jgi:hypothetical protein
VLTGACSVPPKPAVTLSQWADAGLDRKGGRMRGPVDGEYSGPDRASTLLALWSDDPAQVDLLSFDAVAQTLADGLLDPAVDPVALGLSGSWGSGKSTVLGLIEAELERRTTAEDKVLVVSTQPWRYDPATGAKESLIAEVLAALSAEVKATSTATGKAKDLLARLGKRIDWAKAVKLAGTSALTFQIPDIDKLVDLVKPKEGDNDSVRGLDSFRDEFGELVASDELSHVRAVAVLVDDLDRCLPETVVDTLEAMRLFLSVPKMSFVIAADEARVADAIRTRFKVTGRPEAGDDVAQETPQDPATLYLHKIVQTTIPLPALSHFDTQSYLLLLLLKTRADTDAYSRLVERCAQVRRDGGTMEDVGTVEGLTVDDEVAFAARLTPLLYEKLRGNPRYIKRFLNDLHVRRAVARRRGIDLDTAVIAKLMTLESLMPIEFAMVLDWFAQGVMRPQLTLLEERAGQPTAGPSPDDAPDGDRDRGSEAHGEEGVDPGEFTAAMLRWATLAPPLRGVELAPYLTLAASFAGVTLIDDSLPERLRDIAANLLSESRIEQTSVTVAILAELGPGRATDLVRYLGRAVRDQPARQKAGVNAVLRLARQYPPIATAARDALRMLPARDLTIGTPVQFTADDAPEVRQVLRHWLDQRPNETRADEAIRTALQKEIGDTGNTMR